MTAGPWTLVNGARHDFLIGNFPLSASYKVALFLSTSNISVTSTTYAGTTNEVANANGYTTGGISVTLTDTGSTSDAVFFVANPSWLASGGSIICRWAVLYKVAADVMAFSVLDNTPQDTTVTAGNTLTVRSDNTANNPVFTMS